MIGQGRSPQSADTVPATPQRKVGLLGRLLDRLIERLAPAVPDETAYCEFDCRRTDCAQSHWSNCERRLGHVARLRGSGGFEDLREPEAKRNKAA